MTLAALTLAAVALASDPKPDPPPRVWLSSTYASEPGCLPSVRAITYYRRAYTASRQRMGLPGAPPRAWYPCDAAKRRAGEWRDRAKTARLELARWQRTIGKTIDRLNRGLAGTPMHDLGAELEAAGREYGISPYFIAAAAGTESSFGAAACSSNPKNVWGLSSCGPGWHVPTFATWRQAIRFYARFLATRWPHATSPYHFYGYAKCSACWGSATSGWMTSRFGVPAYTRYPA